MDSQTTSGQFDQPRFECSLNLGVLTKVVELEPWLARSRENHYRVDLAEDDVNAAADAGHDGHCRNRDEPREQSIFNEILTTMVAPDLPPR